MKEWKRTRAFLSNLKRKASGAVIGAAVLLGAPLMADDSNLSNALPDSLIDSGFWDAVALVLLSVAAIKGVFIVIRLFKRL